MDTIAIIGLGYVGLPLAHAFSARYKVVGFDVDPTRIEQLRNIEDRTLELTQEQLQEALTNGITFTTDIALLKQCNIFIVTVPTPIDHNKKPNLQPLVSASETVGAVIKKGDIVIYESTVYPGATEEDCVPILEKISELQFNVDFYCGYSPERINPGDKKHTVSQIVKVTSGSTPEIANKVDKLYNSIIDTGTHLAPSIKVAEAAKVIENAQRDINIAFMNELAMMFNKMGIDTRAVLQAASTKWNFLNFEPGLVGGHCIGVDPYYLTSKAEQVGYKPEIILAGRRLNDSMGLYIAAQLTKVMIQKKIAVESSNVLIMGLTFKENCPDLRNTKVVDIVNELRDYGCHLSLYDPWVKPEETVTEFGLPAIDQPQKGAYDAIVLAVGHRQFKEMSIKAVKMLGKSNCVLFDLKGVLKDSDVDYRL